MDYGISKKQIVYYSLLALPLAIIGMPLYIYLPTFYTTNVGVDVATVGLLLFIARVFDVVTDPFFGHLSDKSVQKYGSRKPIMAIGSIVLIYSFYSLINPNKDFAQLWLLFYSILIYIAWSMINIPYLTWSSEISEKYTDKIVLNSSRELFSIVGVLIALVVPYLYGVSQDPQKTLHLLYYSFLIIFIPFFLLSFKNIEIKNTTFSSKFSVKQIKKVYVNIKELKYLQMGYFFNNLANALPATLFLLFIEFIIEAKDFSGLILIVYFFAGIIALPFWNILANKIGKRDAWISSIVLACSGFIFVPFLESGDIALFVIISIVSGFSLGADMALPTSIQGDLVQKSITKDINISGLLFGIWTMITKFSLAIAVALGFSVLGFFGFEATSPTPNALLSLTLLYGFFPVVLKGVALFFILKYKDKNPV